MARVLQLADLSATGSLYVRRCPRRESRQVRIRLAWATEKLRFSRMCRGSWRRGWLSVKRWPSTVGRLTIWSASCEKNRITPVISGGRRGRGSCRRRQSAFESKKKTVNSKKTVTSIHPLLSLAAMCLNSSIKAVDCPSRSWLQSRIKPSKSGAQPVVSPSLRLLLTLERTRGLNPPRPTQRATDTGATLPATSLIRTLISWISLAKTKITWNNRSRTWKERWNRWLIVGSSLRRRIWYRRSGAIILLERILRWRILWKMDH